MFNVDDQIITFWDYSKFIRNEKNTKIHRIWERFISQMPEELKREAIEKGFKLEETSRTTFDINFLIQIPNASAELKNFISQNLYPHFTCILD